MYTWSFCVKLRTGHARYSTCYHSLALPCTLFQNGTVRWYCMVMSALRSLLELHSSGRDHFSTQSRLNLLMIAVWWCLLSSVDWKASSRCSTRVGSTEKSRASWSRYFLCLTTGDLLYPIYSEQCARPWLSLHGLTQSSTCQVGRSAPLWQQQCFHSNPSETSHQPRSLETTLRCKLTVLTMATQHIQHPSQCSANIWQQE